MTLSALMKAIHQDAPGEADSLHLVDMPVPQPQVGEVLIHVGAAGLNRADILQRQGKYPPPADASPILGMEIAGTIVAIGVDVQGWAAGMKVCALLAGGGYAEYAVAPQGQLLPMPEQLSFVEAAALPETIITVWANLFDAGGLRAGETALVHGGSSGIGTTAIQMAKLAGAKIFVTVGSEEKAAACRKLGADLAINYRTDDFVAAIDAATDGRGVDVVLDMIGGDYLNRNLTALAKFGRHVNIATQRGAKAEVDLRLMMLKRLTLTGSTLRARSVQEKSQLVAEVTQNAWNWAMAGQLKPLISQIYPLKNAAQAHKMMESSAHIGKIVLEVAPH